MISAFCAALAMPFSEPSPEQRTIRPAEDTVLNADSWCPKRASQSIDELLASAGMKWNTPYNHSQPARCDLSAKQWLFVVSPGGRTGSTTVMDMINAHPAFDLAGEIPSGQLLTAMELWHDPNSGVMHPGDLLCDLAEWFEDATPHELKGDLTMKSLQAHTALGSPLKAHTAVPTVRGFKEIAWGQDDATALWFLKALFPCHRLVFSERTGEYESKWTAGHRAAMLEHWRGYAKQQPAWHNWWIKLWPDGFDRENFDGMLQWFGEPADGCRFDHVETASGAVAGWGRSGKGDMLDASKCRLRFSGP